MGAEDAAAGTLPLETEPQIKTKCPDVVLQACTPVQAKHGWQLLTKFFACG